MQIEIDRHASRYAAPTADKRGTLVTLGDNRGGRLPRRLTPLEAIAWIATRDVRLVSGIAYHLSNVTESLQKAQFKDEDMFLEFHGSETVESEIADWFCTCAKPLVDRAAARSWHALSETDKSIGRDGQDDDLGWLYECAHKRHCVCFTAAKDQLFRAAIAGDIVATGRLNGSLEPVCRTEWQGRNYDKRHGLILVTAGWVGLTLAFEEIRAQWPPNAALPADAMPTPKSVGRPRASAVPVQIYNARREAGAALMGSQIAEWRLCRAEAERQGHGNLASPKTYAQHHASGMHHNLSQKL